MSFLLTVISNAGPLMALGKLNRLELLKSLYETVLMPAAVYTEVIEQGLALSEPDARLVEQFWRRCNWPIENVTPRQIESLNLQAQLGHGEQEVLALAVSQRFPLVLMDDSVARSEARRLGLHAIGTLGILTQACRQQYIQFSEVELLIEAVIQRPDIWISETLCKQVLEGLRAEMQEVPRT